MSVGAAAIRARTKTQTKMQIKTATAMSMASQKCYITKVIICLFARPSALCYQCLENTLGFAFSYNNDDRIK